MQKKLTANAMNVEQVLPTLEDILTKAAPLAVAVSGGVDSMTLAFIAHRTLGKQATMLHAVSPAVPPDATQRVRDYAERCGWNLELLDAGEFSDARYLANPVNRCFFCKTNLYATMSDHVAQIAARNTTNCTPSKSPSTTTQLLVSGTNTDDLGDYRPGLQAASDHRVRHPYVEAGIDKAAVRALASHFNLTDVAERPAAPCLSSRIETGIAIDAATLNAVYLVERELRQALQPASARCRVRHDKIEVQLDRATLIKTGLSTDTASQKIWEERIASIFSEHAPLARGERPVTFAEYKMGSAFLQKTLPHRIDRSL